VVLVPLAMSNLGPLSGNGLPITYDQFDILKVFVQRGLVLLALGAWIIGLVLRGGKVRTTPVGWLVLAFIAWLVLTTAFSVHVPTAIFGKYRRFEGLISFLTYASVFFLALQLGDRASRIRSLARSLGVAGFVVALYGAVQVMGTVGIGMARVLQPLSVLFTIAAPVALVALALTKLQDDPQARQAAFIGAAVAAVGGVFFSAGLAQNIDVAVQSGSALVALDPVRWGTLPFETNRAFSTFGNPDLLGGYLIFPWAVVIGLALSEEHRLWRAIYWVLTLFNAFVGVTSYVRGAWIGATVSLILLAVSYLRSRSGTETRLSTIDKAFIGAGAATIGVAAVASSLRPDAVRNVFTRVVSIFQFDQGSALTRFQIWEAALAAIAEKPLLGWGADTFRLLFPMFKPAEYVRVAGYLSVADNVHNYPLQLATGIGIPGVLLMYGLIVWVLVRSARMVFARGQGAKRMLLAGFWAAVAGYVVHLLFGLSVTGSTIFLWLSMGLLLSPGATEREASPARMPVLLVSAVVAVVVAGSVLNVRFIVADNAYLRGRVVEQGLERVEAIERAIELNPFNDMYRLELGVAWQDIMRVTARAYAESLESGVPDEQARKAAEAFLQSAASAYEDMIMYEPQEYDTYVFYASLYNEAGSYLDRAYYRRAIEIATMGVDVEPHGPAARVQLASAALALGDPGTAIEHLEVATGLDPRFMRAFGMLGDAYRAAGRVEDARAAYEYVLEREPGNALATTGLKALDSTAPTAQ
jgi:O-antigen ligase